MKKLIFSNTKKMFQTIFSIVRMIKQKVWFVDLGSYNIKKDCRLFILGNGPSLKYDLEKYYENLVNEDTVAVNSFSISTYFEQVKPKYYFFADPAYVVKKDTSIEYLELQNNILNSFVDKVTWDLTIFIPNFSDLKDEFKNISLKNKRIKIKYINTNEVSGFQWISFFFYKLNLGMPLLQNVIIGSIFLGLNIGYKKVYLLGVDHSLHEELKVNEKNQLCIRTKHFNQTSDMKIYYKDSQQNSTFKVHEFFYVWSKTFETYFILKVYARKLNANIYNLTSNSFIDAYQRKNINDIFGFKNEKNL